jgi:hypothetical protein
MVIGAAHGGVKFEARIKELVENLPLAGALRGDA